MIRSGVLCTSCEPNQMPGSEPINSAAEVCNIFQLHKAFSREDTVAHVDVQCRTAGWGCMDCKKVLQESMVQELTPIRRRAEALDAEPQRVLDALASGAETARGIARETMREVRGYMGLDAVSIPVAATA